MLIICLAQCLVGSKNILIVPAEHGYCWPCPHTVELGGGKGEETRNFPLIAGKDIMLFAYCYFLKLQKPVLFDHLNSHSYTFRDVSQAERSVNYGSGAFSRKNRNLYF
jgi:hypothetical protein